MPSYIIAHSDEHFGWLFKGSRPFLRSEGMFDCHIWTFFFGHFCMKKHPELTHKVIFVTALPCIFRQGLEKVHQLIWSVQTLCTTRKSKFSVHFCCWLSSLNFMNCFLFQNLIFALCFFTDQFIPILWNVSQDLANIMLAVVKRRVAYGPEPPWLLAKVDCCQGWLLPRLIAVEVIFLVAPVLGGYKHFRDISNRD